MPHFSPSHLVLSAILGMAAFPGLADAAPQFAKVFTDHAVLQRDKPIPVWGTAAPGATVSLLMDSRNAAVAVADNDGNWKTTLPAMQPGGPHTLVAADGAEATTLNDLRVGDVFLCGGQSNMEFPERLATGAWGDIGGSANPDLRFIIIPKTSEAAPLADLKTPVEWQVVGPDTVGDASAVCYHMALEVQKSEHVPIGMIDTYWGGTTIQSWISPDSLRTSAKYADDLDTLALLARDQPKAYAAQSAREEAWWDAHDPSNQKNRAFIAPGYDDKAWPTLMADKGWKDGVPELKDFDGVVWLRTTVTLTPEQAAKANELTLGPIDTNDTTWINGQWIGSSTTSWLWREYSVPAGVFRSGENVITIRVLGSGGLTGQTGVRFVKTSDGQAIPLPAGWKYKAGMRATGLTMPSAPWAIPTSLSTLYNGMIAPFAGYGIKLAAWYQGESNTGEAGEYRTLLPLLMKDWRETFNDPDLPFFVVQLSSYGDPAALPGPSDWAELREAQRQAVDADAHAGMAVSIDFGDRTDIHPTQKTVIGKRLARAALNVAYGRDVSAGGPEAISVVRDGKDLVISFRRTNDPLQVYGGRSATGFEVCDGGATCVFFDGDAMGEKIYLHGANLPDAVKVRYAWSNAPYVNLYSHDDQPVVPFEMDIAK